VPMRCNARTDVHHKYMKRQMQVEMHVATCPQTQRE